MKLFLVFIYALFTIGICHGATLNFQHDGIKIKILLDTTQRTHPALAMRMNNSDTIYYASLVEDTSRIPGEVYVFYNNKTYRLEHNSKYKFTITTTPNTSSFSFNMSAKGNFTIDWGDGTIDEIIRTNTTNTTYSHTYNTENIHIIGLDGVATGYGTSNTMAAVSFKNTNIAKINGSLGAIFPTIGNGTARDSQPRFYNTFQGCSNMAGSIPDNLFANVSGAVGYMFQGTFYNCSKLSGKIPNKLFSGISGSAIDMFYGTFYGCSKLSGEIPSGLFGNISGAPGVDMFYLTFYGCTNLTGPTVRMSDGTRLYDIMYNGKTWYEQSPSTFTSMYKNSGIDEND